MSRNKDNTDESITIVTECADPSPHYHTISKGITILRHKVKEQ